MKSPVSSSLALFHIKVIFYYYFLVLSSRMAVAQMVEWSSSDQKVPSSIPEPAVNMSKYECVGG